MKRTPFPYQVPVLDYAAKTRHPALFLEMRLGKCFITIADVKRKGCQRILIVCPLSVVTTWVDELHADGERCIIPVAGTKAQRIDLAQTVTSRRTWFIIGYESLRETPELGGCHWSPSRRLINGSMEDVEWDAVILDESTTIRTPTAGITKVVTKGFRGVPHRYLLTGLPNPESAQDFFSQFQFLNNGMMGFKNFWPWREEHFQEVGHEWFPRLKARTDIRDWVRTKACVLTRKQAGIGNRKVYQTRVLQQSPAQSKAIKALVEDYVVSTPERRVAKHAVQSMTWLHQMAGGFNPGDKAVLSTQKLNELQTLLSGELAKEPVLVWFRFNHELHAAQAKLKGMSVACITGDTPKPERSAIRRRFQDGKVRVLLLQTRAAYFGLNLSKSSTAIYFSNYFDAELRAQSEDRIAHPTKSEPLLYVDLVTEDTVDQHVLELLKEKKTAASDYTRKLWRELLKGKA